ncbi:MAG: hypothetical protein RLZ93_1442 [Bacteroidota bacterium]
MKAIEIQITECPRDAMQGIKEWIPTELKVRYLNALLECGFDVLDFGSFVSPKAIPQMQDSATVLAQLTDSKTKLLAIIANSRGAFDAAQHERIAILGYPFSISQTFQLRNTNSTLEQALFQLDEIAAICSTNNKQLRIYLSPWASEIRTEMPGLQKLSPNGSTNSNNALKLRNLRFQIPLGVQHPKLGASCFPI